VYAEVACDLIIFNTNDSISSEIDDVPPLNVVYGNEKIFGFKAVGTEPNVIDDVDADVPVNVSK
jgi:hypothetical protein